MASYWRGMRDSRCFGPTIPSSPGKGKSIAKKGQYVSSELARREGDQKIGRCHPHGGGMAATEPSLWPPPNPPHAQHSGPGPAASASAVPSGHARFAWLGCEAAWRFFLTLAMGHRMLGVPGNGDRKEKQHEYTRAYRQHRLPL